MGLIWTHMLGRMGASQVIALDVLPWRLEWAKRFGATDVVDSSQGDPVEAVTELTKGELVDFCVEAVGQPASLTTAAYLTKPLGRLCVFGMPDYKTQEFPWHDTFRKGMHIYTIVGPECGAFFQTAVDMVVEGRVDLGAMVTPRMPWKEAPQAFDMYADRVEGSLKLTLEL
jgi:S-(hydroxymethyl)mycothiol dehydrogenase